MSDPWPHETTAEYLHSLGECCEDNHCRHCFPILTPRQKWREAWGRMRAGLAYRPLTLDHDARIVLALRDHPYTALAVPGPHVLP